MFFELVNIAQKKMSRTYLIRYTFQNQKRILAKFDSGYDLHFVRGMIPKEEDYIGHLSKNEDPAKYNGANFTIYPSGKMTYLTKFLKEYSIGYNFFYYQRLKLNNLVETGEKVISELEIDQLHFPID